MKIKKQVPNGINIHGVIPFTQKFLHTIKFLNRIIFEVENFIK